MLKSSNSRRATESFYNTKSTTSYVPLLSLGKVYGKSFVLMDMKSAILA
jgi:hypothetical protein